ncbi:hypothetical protein BX600DRAFT_517989 [Xylariales sp. PMI_506]|nr:hypothetical protein BX600DRAFT_517989 [Xylariales sp. PMI_506]
MSLSNTSAFYIINVDVLGQAAKNLPSDQRNYNCIAYIPDYTGNLSDTPPTLPHRERINGVIENSLRDINGGTNPSLLPNEKSLQSPFAGGVTFRFIVDLKRALSSGTGELVGFGQGIDSEKGLNMAVYNVSGGDRKLFSTAALDARVEYVVTNGNVPRGST